MATEEDDEARFLSRTTDLGRDDTVPPRDATITPRTLLRGDAKTRDPAPRPDLPSLATGAEYAIAATLGEGGMGVVRLARQRSLDRDVALKTLHPGAPAANETALFREARVTGALEHPGVIPVHALGLDDDGRPALVMKRVDGVELRTMLRDPTRTGDRLGFALDVLIRVCHAVEFAHSRGVFHRDIKPENVMVGSFGEVYLLDWGVATTASEPPSRGIVGTPVYMAPEMVLGDRCEARTDVYLLGATLHEILTGHAPHDGKTTIAVLRSAVLSAPYPYPDEVPAALADLCRRAMAKDIAKRPPSAQAFREELGDYLRHRSARLLTDAALDRLTTLESELAATTAVPADLARAYRLGTEARFGLTQGLQTHAEDRAAKDGMRRCLAATIELELRQEHADTADALLREMDDPPPELARRIAEIRERVAERARKSERLASMERDLDPTEKAEKRTGPLLVFAVALVAVGIVVGNGASSAAALAINTGVGLVVVAAVTYALRDRLLTNAFNRRLAILLVIAVVASLVNRILAIGANLPLATTLTADLLLFAMGMAGTVVTVMRRLWPGIVIELAGVVAIRAMPDHANVIFITTCCVTLLASIQLLRSERPASR